MMLIGYLHGIASERRLCQEVHLNLAYRWFCGLSLEDKVPHHSTFSKNRHGRFAGTALFRELFYEIVQQAMDKGLVRGKHLSTDATLIDANAAMRSLDPIVVHCGKEAYWQQLDEERCNEPEEQPTDSNSDLEGASDKKGSINQTQRSRTDPDSRVATRWGAKHRLAYSRNYLEPIPETWISILCNSICGTSSFSRLDFGLCNASKKATELKIRPYG